MPVGWSASRRKVLRGSPTCYVCGEPATEVDHVLPRSSGGGETDNLQAICLRCHRIKSSREGVKAQQELRARKRRPEGRHPGSN